MKCKNCGSEDFDRVDGYYECSVCGCIADEVGVDYSTINAEAIELFEKKMFAEAFAYIEKYHYEDNNNLENLLFYYVGNCYECGDGVVKNENMAHKFYDKAINNSPIGNNYNLGRCYNFLGLKYAKGEFFDADNNVAFSLFVKAESFGNIDAKCSVGIFFKNGIVVNKDEAKGFSLIQEAVNGGSERAIFQLARCYDAGIGVIANMQEAYSLYEKASLIGDDRAMVNLGSCFYYGKGVEQDYNEAAKWYLNAANLNNSNAQYNIALCYLKGKGADIDEEKGLFWMKKAADNGYKAAIDYLENKDN